MARNIKLRIWRGDSTDGGLKDVVVEANEGEVVLDVIHRVQATQMGDLAVRWNCKAGKCGSCSMEINGKPRLACMTQVAAYGDDETITITPLRAFPVIKDLVADVSFNYQKAMEIPAYAPPADLKLGEARMQQIDVERSQEFRNCIECFLCQDVCHVVRDHEDVGVVGLLGAVQHIEQPADHRIEVRRHRVVGVARVAQARGLDPSAVAALVAQQIENPDFGVIGQARVNVLELNLALDAL